MALIDDMTERKLTSNEWTERGKVRGKPRKVSKDTQSLRRTFLDIYAQTNGMPIEEVIAGIKTKSQLYESARNVIGYCQVQSYAVETRGVDVEVFSTPLSFKRRSEPLPVMESYPQSRRLQQVEADLTILKRFGKSLRADDKIVLEDLLDQCRIYAGHASSIDSVVREYPLFLSMLFGQHKKLTDLEKRLILLETEKTETGILR